MYRLFLDIIHTQTIGYYCSSLAKKKLLLLVNWCAVVTRRRCGRAERRYWWAHHRIRAHQGLASSNAATGEAGRGAGLPLSPGLITTQD